MKNFLLLTSFIFGFTSLATSFSHTQKQLLKEEAGEAIVQISDSIKLTEYSIHLVKLPFPYTPVRQGSETHTHTKAWLILFRFDGKLPNRASGTDFYIGNYYVSEYGSWSKGIYFRIYESALFERLSGKEILIRGPLDKRPVSTKVIFQIRTPLNQMEFEDEDTLLGLR